jgi:hypothetical protein
MKITTLILILIFFFLLSVQKTKAEEIYFNWSITTQYDDDHSQLVIKDEKYQLAVPCAFFTRYFGVSFLNFISNGQITQTCFSTSDDMDGEIARTFTPYNAYDNATSSLYFAGPWWEYSVYNLYPSMYIYKHDLNCNKIWNKTLTIEGKTLGVGDMIVDKESNLYILVRVVNPPYPYFGNLTIFKFDQNGNQIWNKTYEVLNNLDSTEMHLVSYEARIDSQNNLYVLRNKVKKYAAYYQKVALLKISPSGSLLWFQDQIGTGDPWSDMGSFTIDKDDNVLLWVWGVYSENAYLIKIDGKYGGFISSSVGYYPVYVQGKGWIEEFNGKAITLSAEHDNLLNISYWDTSTSNIQKLWSIRIDRTMHHVPIMHLATYPSEKSLGVFIDGCFRQCYTNGGAMEFIISNVTFPTPPPAPTVTACKVCEPSQIPKGIYYYFFAGLCLMTNMLTCNPLALTLLIFFIFIGFLIVKLATTI